MKNPSVARLRGCGRDFLIESAASGFEMTLGSPFGFSPLFAEGADTSVHGTCAKGALSFSNKDPKRFYLAGGFTATSAATPARR